MRPTALCVGGRPPRGSVIHLFQSSLPASFHRSLVDELDSMDAGELGHELATLLPSVLGIVKDAVVISEVERMLGSGACPDGCMHLHLNDRPADGDWHQDDYCGAPWPREMAILCYFPQDTPPEMGPTEARCDGRQILAAGHAGTCLLMRHDVVHRATANHTGRQRYMLKFLWRAEFVP